MKKRVKIDSSILSFIIILTGILYRFHGLYPQNLILDDICDFIGLFLVLSGTFVRMAARGYKKEHSGKGGALVTDGPYAVVRNPMYLGSFLMGAGFVLILWPWWSLPLFALVFYLRFRRQIVKEEALLAELFGSAYREYCQKVPRLLPTIPMLKKTTLRKVFPIKTSFNTKEKWGLLWWPVLAVILELFQEKVVFGFTDLGRAVVIFGASMAIFAVVLIIE